MSLSTQNGGEPSVLTGQTVTTNVYGGDCLVGSGSDSGNCINQSSYQGGIATLTSTSIAAAPTATTSAASSVTTTGATLNGTVNDNGALTTVIFNYGTTVSYGSTATASQSPISAGTGSTSVTAALTGLTCNTTYHYQVSATNSVNTTNGSDATFTTAACPASALSTFIPNNSSSNLTPVDVTAGTAGSLVSLGFSSYSAAPNPKEPLNKSVFLLAKTEVGRFFSHRFGNSGFGS